MKNGPCIEKETQESNSCKTKVSTGRISDRSRQNTDRTERQWGHGSNHNENTSVSADLLHLFPVGLFYPSSDLGQLVEPLANEKRSNSSNVRGHGKSAYPEPWIILVLDGPEEKVGWEDAQRALGDQKNDREPDRRKTRPDPVSKSVREQVAIDQCKTHGNSDKKYQQLPDILPEKFDSPSVAELCKVDPDRPEWTVFLQMLPDGGLLGDTAPVHFLTVSFSIGLSNPRICFEVLVRGQNFLGPFPRQLKQGSVVDQAGQFQFEASTLPGSE